MNTHKFSRRKILENRVGEAKMGMRTTNIETLKEIAADLENEFENGVPLIITSFNPLTNGTRIPVLVGVSLEKQFADWFAGILMGDYPPYGMNGNVWMVNPLMRVAMPLVAFEGEEMTILSVHPRNGKTAA